MSRPLGVPSRAILLGLFARGGSCDRRQLRADLGWAGTAGIQRMTSTVRTLLLNDSIFLHSPRGAIGLTELGTARAKQLQPDVERREAS